MNILALDTATDASSAAILCGGQMTVDFQLAPRQHTKILLTQLDNVLDKSGIVLSAIDVVAFGRGPGAFTGLRIAAGVAQGIALAIDKPVVPVSSLAAMALQAAQAYQATEILVALDARMGEVYWGQYRQFDKGIELLGKECVSKPEALTINDCREAIAIGAGWGAYQDILLSRCAAVPKQIIAEYYPSAAYIAKLAAIYPDASRVDASEAQPVYLRNKVAQTLQERGVT